LKIHSKDYSSQRGLRKLLGKRKCLLSYLSNEDVHRYENLITHLGIRGLKKMIAFKRILTAANTPIFLQETH